MDKYVYTVFKSSSGRKYWYDTVTNNIIRITDALYFNHRNIADSLQYKICLSGKQKEGLEYLKNRMIKPEYILPFNVSKIDYPHSTEEYVDFLNDCISHMVLSVTEQCNMRCNYCSYSGHYHTMRKHSANKMPYEIAKKAIDYYYKHSNKCNFATISFYGGEPLLEFENIKKIVEYSKNIFEGKRQCYLITTNGTLINTEVINWLNSNSDVYVNITLNGDRLLHDKHRRYLNGKGTHDDIVSNLTNLKNKYSKLYEKRISFLSNYSSMQDIKRLQKFYDDEMHTSPEIISRIIESNGDEFIQAIFNTNNSKDKEIHNELFQMYIKLDNSEQKFVNKIFDKSLAKIHTRDNAVLSSQGYITGTCMPFLSRIFVNCYGSFSLCEKTCAIADFGNVYTGVNIKNTLQIMETYKESIVQDCINCWAQRLCRICFNHAFKNNTIDNEHRKSQCEVTKKSISNDLSLYCDVIEQTPHKREIFESFISPEIYRDYSV